MRLPALLSWSSLVGALGRLVLFVVFVGVLAWFAHFLLRVVGP